MKTAANYPAIETEPKSAFRAVLVCEDDASLKTGTETCRLLLSCFENRLPFQLQIWPFAIFQSNDLNLDAVRDAVAADAIIVATHRQNDLPPAIKDWINAWVPQKQTQTAILIGLFHRNGNSQTVPVVTFEYLKKAAKDAGMDFLVRQNVLEENTSEPPPQPQESVIFANPEGWGLND